MVAELHTRGEQGLFDAIVECVDPAIYNGRKITTCLIGQVDTALVPVMADGTTAERVATFFQTDPYRTMAIFALAACKEYSGDYEAAKEMARQILVDGVHPVELGYISREQWESEYAPR